VIHFNCPHFATELTTSPC
jgi:DNA-binding NtrC family response regulator